MVSCFCRAVIIIIKLFLPLQPRFELRVISLVVERPATAALYGCPARRPVKKIKAKRVESVFLCLLYLGMKVEREEGVTANSQRLLDHGPHMAAEEFCVHSLAGWEQLIANDTAAGLPNAEHMNISCRRLGGWRLLFCPRLVDTFCLILLTGKRFFIKSPVTKALYLHFQKGFQGLNVTIVHF